MAKEIQESGSGLEASMTTTKRRLATRTLCLSALFVLASIPALGSVSVTIKNVPPTPHYAPPGTTLADIAATIKFAADTYGWNAIEETSNSVIARLRVRTHTAVVKIGFDEASYWIQYMDSTDLNFNPNDRKKTKTQRAVEGPRIHRNYNKWIQNLQTEIEDLMKNPRSASHANSVHSSSPLMIADELEKLDALRSRGVLTQEEFDQQKAKLLAR